MKRKIIDILILGGIAGLIALIASGAKAQTQGGGIAFQPLGYCQIASVTSSTAQLLSACTSSSFTGTASGAVLTASSVTGAILPGQTITGTGVPANTTIINQLTGSGGCAPVFGQPGSQSSCAAGGAGTYTTSVATTASSASLTGGGIPIKAKYALIRVDQSMRWRDDGGVPTSSIGMLLNSTDLQGLFYSGNLNAIQFIAQSTSGAVNAVLYAGNP
jgi:hypothetical protein